MISRTTFRTASQQTSRNAAGAGPRNHKPHAHKVREIHEAIIEDAGATEDRGRDLAQGEGGTIGPPTKPGDLSKDD